MLTYTLTLLSIPVSPIIIIVEKDNVFVLIKVPLGEKILFWEKVTRGKTKGKSTKRCPEC